MSNHSNAPSLISLSQRLFKLYQSYFGLKGQQLKRTLAALSMFGLNILSAFVTVLINSTMDSFLGVLEQPGVTYAAYFSSLGYFVGAITISCTLMLSTEWLSSWLSSSISYAMNKRFSDTWLKTKAYYGTKFMTNKNNKLDAAQIMSHDNPNLSSDAIDMANNLLMVIGNFVVGVVGLYQLSVPLTITLYATTVTIPAFMLLSSIAYAAGYNVLTTITGRSLKKQLDIKRNIQSDFHHKMHHVDVRAEAIAFKKGESYETNSLLETLKKNKIIQRSVTNVRASLLFLNVFNSMFSSFVSYILASPSIIAGKMNLSAMFQISGHFQNVVRMFTWHSDKFNQITSCEVTLNKIESLEKQMKDWEALTAKTQSALVFSLPNKRSKQISVHNLTLKKPDNSVILKDLNLTMPRGKATLIEGDSGVGKTSVLRSLAGLNPLATGKINGLNAKKHFIPSEPYFPHNKTLVEAILYPRTTSATPAEIKKIKTLMRALGFDKSKMDELDQVKDWYGSVFSDGQRKRIMIISAILSEPEVLVMDEGTRGLDHTSKTKVEKALKKYLPNTTIIYTDHNPSESNFCDKKIKLA